MKTSMASYSEVYIATKATPPMPSAYTTFCPGMNAYQKEPYDANLRSSLSSSFCANETLVECSAASVHNILKKKGCFFNKI